MRLLRGGRDKTRREQSERLRGFVEALTGYPAETGYVLGWGRGILEEMDPGIGPHVTDSVYVVTDKALYYQYLEEAPSQIRSMRSLVTGVTPAEWRALARNSASAFFFASFGAVDARRAVDGRWDVALIPRSAASESNLRGFGLIESYGGRPTDELATFIRSLPNGPADETENEQALSRSMFDGSRPDATKEEIESAGREDVIHPRTNWERIYSVVFEPKLSAGEAQVAFRAAQMSGAIGSRSVPDWLAGWVLLTNRRVHWHAYMDGLPNSANTKDILLPDIPRTFDLASIEKYVIKEYDGDRDYAPTTVVLLTQRAATNSKLVMSLAVGRDTGSSEFVTQLAARMPNARHEDSD